jgi:hypothetical protein
MSRRRFLVEAEELMKQMPAVLYHAGNPALWALVVLEAGECPQRQAKVLHQRVVASTVQQLLSRMTQRLVDAFDLQEEALSSKDKERFQPCKSAALEALQEARQLAEELTATSKDNEGARTEQAQKLRSLFDMKDLKS